MDSYNQLNTLSIIWKQLKFRKYVWVWQPTLSRMILVSILVSTPNNAGTLELESYILKWIWSKHWQNNIIYTYFK